MSGARRIGSAIRWVVFFVAVAVSAACVCWVHDSYQRAQQLRTYTDRQVTVHRIEAVRARGELTVSRLHELALEDEGVDSWGHELRLAWRSSGTVVDSYLLLSPGADGELDVDTLEAYFEADVESVAGKPESDIVFRDGEPIRNAGK